MNTSAQPTETPADSHPETPVEAPAESAEAKPLRADAARNRAKVLAAARDAFTENGASTSLEAIARRAGVGIGTLYRHFPTRQSLLEAVYVDEVEQIARSAAELSGLEPWDALSSWLRGVGSYLVTKKALAAELLNYVDQDAAVFGRCRRDLFEAGQPLLDHAREAGIVRADAQLSEIISMVGGIAKIQVGTPEEIGRILTLALDGLRYQTA